MYDRLKAVTPDPKTLQLALAELVIAVERLHEANILHRDLGYQNILIDSDGRLVLIDLGYAVDSANADDKNCDWKTLSFNWDEVIPKSNRSDIQTNLIEFLENMTDDQILGESLTENAFINFLHESHDLHRLRLSF